DAVLAGVGRKPKLQIRFDRVASLILQRVRAQLVSETDAATLMPAQVHNDALTFACDALKRTIELYAAVASQRAEHVAGEAFRVHAHEYVVLSRDFAPHKSEMLGAV